MSTPDDPRPEEHHRAPGGESRPGGPERGPHEGASGGVDHGAPGGVDDGAQDGADDARVPFTERHRTAVGVLVVVLCLAVAVFFAVVGPAGADEPEPWGPILRWAAPVLWVGLAAVAGAWAAGVRQVAVNRMAGVVLVAYLAYLVVRMF